MAERDPVAATLEHVEHPVAPDRAFAQALLDDLLNELGDDEGHHRRTVGRLRRSPGWRKALTIAAAFAIATAGLAMLQPFARPTVLPASVSELGPFPLVSFRGTVVAGPVDQATGTPIGDVTYASQFSWKVTARGAYLPGGTVSYPSFGDEGAVSRDGDAITSYSSRTNSTTTGSVRSATVAPVYSPAKLLTWEGTMAFSWARACAPGRIVGEELVEGIRTVRVRCPDVKFLPGDWYSPRMNADVWVDPSTGIVLRIETAGPPGRSFDAGGFSLTAPNGAGQRWELVNLRIGDVGSASYTPPSGAIDATGRTVLTSVRIGEPMPPVELPLVTGGPTTLGGTPGRPTAVYFWDRSCYGVGCSMLTLIRQLASRTDIDVIVVVDPNWTDAAEIRRAIAPAHVSVPVALDPEGVASDLIAGQESNTLLLLDASGSLEGAYAGNYGKHLAGILTAFAAGEPLPTHVGGLARAQLP